MKKKILIVDDHPDALKVMHMQLSMLGDFEVYEAFGGKEALALFKKHHPDIVFVDITMPGLNGYETMKLMRKEERGRGLPIVAWSTLLQDELGDLKGAGFSDYLSKFSGGRLSLREMLKKHGLIEEKRIL